MAKWKVCKDGQGKMSTDYDSCMPPDDIIRDMIAGGYKIYKDGKIYKPPTKKIKGGQK